MNELSLPISYYFALLLSAGSFAFALFNLRETWTPSFLAVSVTFFAWYIVEPIYAPDNFRHFDPSDIAAAYYSATLFLVSFIIMFFTLRRQLELHIAPRPQSTMESFYAPGAFPPERLAIWAIGVWLILLSIGTMRLNGDLMNALFPVSMRNGTGASMWQRHAGADAGPTGFLVSTASYLYLLVLSSFGLLLPLVRAPRTRLILLLVILIAWPYAFLSGARSIVLVTVMPLFLSFFLFGQSDRWIKFVILTGSFFVLEFAMRVIIALRNTGFELSMLNEVGSEQRHLGLEMGSELIWITSFLESDKMEPTWGGQYLTEIVNFVPRSIWPNKPLIGIDYAMLRGVGGADNDIGVFATISTGMIGQGVVNFGMLLGPIAAALLMAIWANFLHRLRLQATSPRLALFLLGLGLTFNLGRDITLLVLFPFVFGYIAVRFIESRGWSSPSQARRAPELKRVEIQPYKLRMRRRPVATRPGHSHDSTEKRS